MSAAPRFSIIMPVYNAGAYLEDSLASVLAQTCDDYEVILIDDGSVDGSGEKCDAHAAAHGSCQVIHQENQGPLLARRAGFARARGEYLVLLDADDELRPDALTVLTEAIEEHHPDIVAFAFARERDFSLYGPSQLPVEKGYYEGPDFDVFRRIVCGGRHVNMCTKIFRREMVDMGRDYAPYTGMAHAEDLFQLLPLADRARSFAYCPEALYYYRSNEKSSTASFRPRQIDDLIVALDALQRYAATWGGDCPRLAKESCVLQCSYLLHILLRDTSARRQWAREFDRLCAYAAKADLFGAWTRELRMDKRCEAWAMRRRSLRAARFFVWSHGVLKAARDGLANR